MISWLMELEVASWRCAVDFLDFVNNYMYIYN
jgi:hypothetical protein